MGSPRGPVMPGTGPDPNTHPPKCLFSGKWCVLAGTPAGSSAIICHQRLDFPVLGLVPEPQAARCCFQPSDGLPSPPRSPKGPHSTCSWTGPAPAQARGTVVALFLIFFSPSLEILVLGGEGRTVHLGTNLLLIMQINARLM